MKLLDIFNPAEWPIVKEKAQIKAIQTLAPLVQNDLFRALYKYIGQGDPVYFDFNQEAYIKHGYCANDDVFSIVSYIARKVSLLPWRLYRIKKDGELEEIKNHEILNLISRPNAYMGQAQFIFAEVAYKLITGNTYQFLNRGIYNDDPRAKPVELFVMPAHLTQINFGTPDQPYGSFQLRGEQNKKWKPHQVIHRKEFNPLMEDQTDLYGMSRIRAGAKVISQGNTARDANSRSFQNMGAYGILSDASDTNKGQPSITTEAQAIALEKKIQGKMHGIENYMKVFVSAVKLDFLRLGMSPTDLKLLEAAGWTTEKIANLYSFPVVLLNSQKQSTYNNVKEAKKAAYEDAILPEAYALRDEWNRQLVPLWGNDLWLDVDTSGVAVLQEDKNEQSQWLDRAWYITPNEKRYVLGYEEIKDPEMDKVYIPSSLQPLDKANAKPEELPEIEDFDDEEDAAKVLARLGLKEYSSNGNGRH